MRFVLAVLLILHALVHVLGILAAWGHASRAAAATQREPTTPVTRVTVTVLWTVALVAFLVASVGLFQNETWWRWAAGAGLVASSVAIAMWWRDAKFGVPVNLLVLAAVAAAPAVAWLP